MTFIEEIRQMKEEMMDKKLEVKEEIHDYFYHILYSERFTTNLKERFARAYRDGKNEVTLYVEWWPGASGCSQTNFSITCCGEWYPNRDETIVYSYKGVELSPIAEDVVYDLKEMLLSRLYELELESRADYEEKRIGKEYVVTVRA